MSCLTCWPHTLSQEAFALGAFNTWALRAPSHHSQARMTHPLPVPTPPRHSPACRSLSESTLALEPWDHRLPSSRFALLQRQPSPARSGASRVSPGRGTRRACPARPQRCLLHPWGTGLATQCRWLAPPPDVTAPLTPWVSLGRPETSCAPLPVEYSTGVPERRCQHTEDHPAQGSRMSVAFQ